MTSTPEQASESTTSKLAFTLACWGLILPVLCSIPAVVLGHIGVTKDKRAATQTKTAIIALAMGYCEVAVSSLATFLYFCATSR
jgi:hypothetical protein